MKSQFYREISQEQKTRKSTAKNKTRKDLHGLDMVNPMKVHKGLKSIPRGQVHSIDISKRLKNDNEQSMLRISFSRPFIREESLQLDKPEIPFCIECESMRADHQRNLKELKMRFQEEATQLKSKYIQMQKKYLLKEQECLQMSSDHINLLDSYGEVEDRLKDSLIEVQDLKEKCCSNEGEIVRLLQDIKRYQDQNRFFNQFLSVFVDQTKCMINWCKLFEQTCDQLPAFISQVREDLFCKKVDLDLMLKESIHYKNSNFGTQTIREIDGESCFFGSEEDNSTSFMKYFKQNNNDNKNKGGKFFPRTQVKERACLESFSVNKENIDTMNRPSAFESLIRSRLNEKVHKNKTEKMNEDFMRILLTQAQTLESSHEFRYSSIKSNSNYDMNVSLLSSITKQVDFDIY